jgi:hypothetical protein
MQPDLAAIEWRNLPGPRSADRHDYDQAMEYAKSWLGDFGLSLFAGDPPDACARLDLDRFAFRIDSAERSIVVLVTVDYDADGTPGEGWTDLSRAVRVEVVRAP